MAVLDLIKPTKSSAAGQYLGYSLQQLRLCHHLLRVPDGDDVSLEHLDDTAIHRSNGTLVLEQSKSALSGNPTADRSVDLWKAMSNWSTLCESNDINPEQTTFRYYVTPKKSGSIIHELHSATIESDVVNVLMSIKSWSIKRLQTPAAVHILRTFLVPATTFAKQ